jgi:hypothetical protein
MYKGARVKKAVKFTNNIVHNDQNLQSKINQICGRLNILLTQASFIALARVNASVP